MDYKYKKAFSEVYSIIDILEENLKNRIPNEIINMIMFNMDENFIFKYDKKKTIDKQNISNEAKSIIAFLYKKYICSEEEKGKWQEYDKFKAERIRILKKK